MLVAVSNGDVTPKVIDFGVAKALHARLTERTLTLTHAHHHVAWLAYYCGLGRASREAAEASIRIAEEQGFAFWIAAITRECGTP